MVRKNNQVRTVLVVDDFEDMRSILRLWLEKRGYRVVEAHDGEHACQVARIEHPDVILMDIGMPRRSGISATYKIRKDPKLKGVPVIAITAYETIDLHEAAIKAGCVECLCKPIDDNKLGDLLTALLQSPKSN